MLSFYMTPDQNPGKGQEEAKQQYKVPEKIVSATIHFLYGFSEKGKFASVKD